MIFPSILMPLALYRTWRRRRIKQQSALLALPLDILLLIEDFLGIVEKVALRLTCYHLYHHKPQLNFPLLGADRAALLRLREHDDPRRYYCHSCQVLHPARKLASIIPADNSSHSFMRYGCHAQRPKRTWRADDGPCCLCDQEQVFISSKYVLHFDLARLAVVRTLRAQSRSRVIPLDFLTRRIEPTSSGCFYTSTSESWVARIIENHVFLSSTRITDGNVKHGVTADGKFTPGFDRHQYAICRHLDFFFGMKIGGVKISCLEQYLRYTGGEFRGSCEYCLTDYQLEQDWEAKTVTLTTFHCLGPCQSPEDWIWQAYTKRMKYGTVMPTAMVTAPCPRKSWVSGTLVFKPFDIKRKEIWPSAVVD